MKKILILLISVTAQFFFIDCSSENQISVNEKDTLFVASWNVENLFDTTDDPDKNDEEYTPSGRREWDETRLNQKLRNTAEVINYMNNGKGIDLLALQEVEHESLLERLNKEYLQEKNYKTVYAESLDKRGIDNALMYNADIFNFISFDTLRVDLADGWPTRYILYSKLMLISTNEYFHVFVNHWPSRSGGKEKSEPNRIAAAQTLKTFTDSLFDAAMNENIIILGDFNDNPVDNSVYDILSAREFDCGIDMNENLYNIAYSKYKEGFGSYLYRGSWFMLDQIILSGSLVDSKKTDYVCGSFNIIKPDFMINKTGQYAGSSIRTFGGKNYIGGYSDHYPISAKFVVKK